MGFFHNVFSLWKSLRLNRSLQQARGRRTIPSVEPLEVRTLLTGEFTDLGALGLPGVEQSSVAWGDMDNDGDLDILLSGLDSAFAKISRVYRNNGDSTFTDINAGLTGVYRSSVAWGDMDNDGDLDILLTGLLPGGTNSPIAKVYRNDGNSTFTDINAGLAGVSQGSVAWGDADNDGDLDILLSGRDGSTSAGISITKIYRNDGGSTFTDVIAGLTGALGGSSEWGDMDNDGDLDILITGRHVSSTDYSVAKVYRNNGNMSFVQFNSGISGHSDSSAEWGDVDNDGDLDILLSGWNTNNGRISRVLRNDGNSSQFQSSVAGLTGVNGGSVGWGDMDNDGDLDILLSGNSTNGNIAKVYRNDGNYTFTDIGAGLKGVYESSVAWGDFDNDGDLDFILTGDDGTQTRFTKFYRNNSSTTNTAPNAPSNLTATIASSTSVTFAWTAPTDSQTPSPGLSYNIRIGTTPGGSDVFSTMASTANGTRRIPDGGPIQGTSFTLKSLTFDQTYYWSVQAIDTAFAGSSFAAEQSVLVDHSPVVAGAPATQSVDDNTTTSPFTSLSLTDPDDQDMFARVTILNGVFRGDFTSASVLGWTRTVVGNDIKYERYYNAQANIGSVVQSAVRLFVFRPRTNAITPNTTELTDITLYVSDGSANATATTRLITNSVNDVPTISGASTTITVNDDSTVIPLPNLMVSDADYQEMLISVTILNGLFRGDFTNANAGTGWTVRYTTGNDITYKQYFSPQANVGAVAQAAFRALIFQPRQNAINPGTTELTDFQVTVSDGVAPAVLGPNSRVTTTSVNDSPSIGGAVANQTVNDDSTISLFSSLTVTDPDTQDMFVRVTITNGVNRGDFTTGSWSGWTRTVSGVNILFERYFSPGSNIGGTVQSAIRALVFQPRNNVPIGTTETTSFTVYVTDGIANTTNSTTSVITTGVAPRLAPPPRATVVAAPEIFHGESSTVILSTVRKPTSNPLARLLKKPR